MQLWSPSAVATAEMTLIKVCKTILKMFFFCSFITFGFKLDN